MLPGHTPGDSFECYLITHPGDSFECYLFPHPGDSFECCLDTLWRQFKVLPGHTPLRQSPGHTPLRQFIVLPGHKIVSVDLTVYRVTWSHTLETVYRVTWSHTLETV